MKHGIYTIYDLKAESYVQPILSISATDEVARRDFVTIMSDPKVKHPADYNLIRLGSYDVMYNKIIPSSSDPVANPIFTGRDVVMMLREQSFGGDPTPGQPRDVNFDSGVPDLKVG